LLYLELILNNLLTLYWCSLFEKEIETNWICLSSLKPNVLPGCATPRLQQNVSFTFLWTKKVTPYFSGQMFLAHSRQTEVLQCCLVYWVDHQAINSKNTIAIPIIISPFFFLYHLLYQIRWNWVDNVEFIYKHQLLRTIDPDKGTGSALLEYLLKKNQNSRLLVGRRNAT
jgi:hypothetical protein